LNPILHRSVYVFERGDFKFATVSLVLQFCAVSFN